MTASKASPYIIRLSIVLHVLQVPEDLGGISDPAEGFGHINYTLTEGTPGLPRPGSAD
jgi:hypothetical protein